MRSRNGTFGGHSDAYDQGDPQASLAYNYYYLSSSSRSGLVDRATATMYDTVDVKYYSNGR